MEEQQEDITPFNITVDGKPVTGEARFNYQECNWDIIIDNSQVCAIRLHGDLWEWKHCNGDLLDEEAIQEIGSFIEDKVERDKIRSGDISLGSH
jgi:hypothetical protein